MPPGSRTRARPVTPVAIAADELARLTRRLEDEGADVAGQLARVRDLVQGLDPYVARCTTPESPALARVAQRTRAHDWGADDGSLEQEMLSGHVEGQVLKMLVGLGRARRVLEVGMFTGYSALAMAEALGPEGRVVACEVDAEVAELARACFRESPEGYKIEVCVAPAHDTLAELAEEGGESFDLIFLDADKQGYAGYLDQILDGGLLAADGVLCVDNTLLQGLPYADGERTANGQAIADFNAKLAADERVEQVLLGVRDGLTLVRHA